MTSFIYIERERGGEGGEREEMYFAPLKRRLNIPLLGPKSITRYSN